MRIRIPIQAERVGVLAPVAVFRNEPADIRIIVTGAQVVESRFFVIEFACIPNGVGISFDRQDWAAEDVVVVAVLDLAGFADRLYDVAMAVEIPGLQRSVLFEYGF